MTALDPIGLDALLEAGARWLARSWVIVPAMGLSVAAVIARFRAARRDFARLDARGGGPWRDGRACVWGTLEVGAPGDGEGFAPLFHFMALKPSAVPFAPTIESDLRVHLADGRALHIAAGTSLRIHSIHHNSVRRTSDPGAPNASARLRHQVAIARGVTVWVVGPLSEAATRPGLRDAAVMTPEGSSGLELHFSMPRPEETGLGGSVTLLWTSWMVAVLLAFSDGWTVPLGVLGGCLAALSGVSIRRSMAPKG